MGGRNCCVKNCRHRSHDHHGRKLPNGLTFHCFPAWRRNEGSQISELTKRRRMAWVAAVNRSNITFNHVPTSMRVCSRHFHSGKPAYEMLESDPDWVPSLQMGHSEGDCRQPERLLSEQPERQREKQSWTTETRPSQASPCPQRESETAGRAVRPWRDIRSLLLSALQHPTSIGEQSGDETQQQAAAVNQDVNFRDFFKDTLEASLEASSRSRSLRQLYVPRERAMELNFKLPPLQEENQRSEGSSSSSSCLTCVRLQRRIRELQEKLSQDKEAPTVLQPNQDLQRCDASANISTPIGAAVSRDKPRRRRRPPRFQASWLKTFWFLRYSPMLDQMWCHVCRLHADKSFQNSSLTKGSRKFRIHNIKKHSDSNYHKENVERHMLYLRHKRL
ncbi:uncharacterized protein LOC121608395 [Chelmon rostratus]|uniref:uncharacterized protein LOC121608395 n=1 Tax=Chelmon rostratus TaxID=109905 RepID=UPI001BE5BAAE|nr:uncharacterized protein LOC121608395 [Chelmon rostratus]